MALLSDTGQCRCGIHFEDAECGDFLEHVLNGTHERCLAIAVCGACFMGLCNYCELSRGDQYPLWYCRCHHDFQLKVSEGVVTSLGCKLAWSDWLEAGSIDDLKPGITHTPNREH